ncbi:MAG: hypothetical protein Q9160_009140 [Pyrenula sp. 1 TL-2023]
MPRPKRALSQIDPNVHGTPGSNKRSKNAPKLIHANPNCPVEKQEENRNSNTDKPNNTKPGGTKKKITSKKEMKKYPSKKDPKLIHTNPNCPVKKAEDDDETSNGHPEIDVSIAERFKNPSLGMIRVIQTYPDLQMSEMKELLNERSLKVSGKKAELIERLEKWDEEHLIGARKIGDDHREALARQPVPIGAKASEMGPNVDHPCEAMVKRGPRGPPVYDEMGFELDYERCTGGPRSKQAILNACDRSLERSEKARNIKSRVIGVKVDDSPMMEQAWNDRVSKDLGIPFHEVGPEQFEKWQEKGFKASRNEIEKVLKQDGERLEFLMTGCALRKGSIR